jgi:hypothetical protein
MTPERHRAQRRARILRIRKRVAAASVIVFLALFSTIYVQMALGHDPALGSQKSHSTKAKARASTGSAQSATQQQETESQQSTPSAVTTSQS